MAHILAVDDDPVIQATVGHVLQDAGHEVTLASGGHEAVDWLARQRPDLVILDITMPEMNGLEVCKRIRADPFTAKLPVIFLTSRDRPSDLAKGLDVGGDDFVTKAFIPVVLPARVRAVLRRAPGGTLDPEAEYLVVGDLHLHVTRHEVIAQNQTVRLTPVEHRLLYYLMRHAGHPISTEQLLQDVWDYPPGTGDPKVVRVTIGRLRAKVERQPDAPTCVRNIRGRGYLVGH
jgi:two-component system response regulator MtrA